MSWISLKDMSAVIGIGLVIMVISGALLNYLQNPIWIGVFLGTIIITGLITLFCYFYFLWEFIEQKGKLRVRELEKELEAIKRR